MMPCLLDIQSNLRAPKNSFNSFGKYKYRSAESILEAVKPLLNRFAVQLTLTDDVISVGDRIYIKSTATLKDSAGNTETVTAFAREDEVKKGMDGSQITGTASSYARKYALNGLFLIDDAKDADTDEYHLQTTEDITPPPKPETANKKISQAQQHQLEKACEKAGGNFTIEKALEACNKSKVEDITVTQFHCLMQRLQSVA